MFEMGTAAWVIVARTALVYLAVFVGLRLAGKRELGQMTVFDLVVILLIANAVQNAMVGADFSVQGGILAAFILLVLNRAFALLRLRSGAWGRLVEGSPTVLVTDGELVSPHMKKEGLEEADLEKVIREHGIDSMADVKLAILETDGSISIVPKSSRVVRTHKHVRQLRKR